MNKKKILDSLYYSFSAASRIIVFDSSLGLKKEDILLIVNQSGNKMIYNFACADEGGVFSNGVLALTFDTTSMSDSDQLTVIVSDKDNTELYLKQILDEIRNGNELLFKLNENKQIEL